MRLSELKIGNKARVTGLLKGQAAAYRQRLIAMGLLPGATFVVSRVAPLGDPIEITLRGFSLSLRKAEASILEIEKITE